MHVFECFNNVLSCLTVYCNNSYLDTESSYNLMPRFIRMTHSLVELNEKENFTRIDRNKDGI